MGNVAAQREREKRDMERDERLIEALTELREWADHIGDPILAGHVNSIRWHGVDIGYSLVELSPGVLQRRVYLHWEQPFIAIPEDEASPVILSCLDVFIDEAQGEVEIGIEDDWFLIRQDVMPIVVQKGETAKTHIKIDDDLEAFVQKSMRPWGN